VVPDVLQETITGGDAACLLLLLREAIALPGRRGAQQRRLLADLLRREGSAAVVLARHPERPISLLQDQALRECQELVRKWSLHGIRLVGIHSFEYPALLRSIDDPPPAIFARGRFLTGVQKPVSVIGSRAASGDGTAITAELARDLLTAGFSVVSGLAVGIDAAAHREALRLGGQTIAVLGTGLLRSYPAQHAQLQEEIARSGSLVSQFLPETPPARENFPRRNLVMAGLTLATIVVEASEHSGARAQARYALASGRSLFLHELALRSQWARDLSGHRGVSCFNDTGELITQLEQCWSP
jgi:DNA processing protein